MDTLREKAIKILEVHNAEPGEAWNWQYWKEKRGGLVDMILSLIRAEVEKVENPYQDKLGMIIESDGFEACRKAVLKALE